MQQSISGVRVVVRDYNEAIDQLCDLVQPRRRDEDISRGDTGS